jgi:hypothetical protein
VKQQTDKLQTAQDFAQVLEPHAGDPAVAAIIATVRASKDHSFNWYSFNHIIKNREPKFLYFDEYYQMRGCENIDALQARQTQQKLEPSDQPLLGLIELARLDLSQNKHLQMRFDVRPARPGDPEHMREGTNIWGEVYDTTHAASTGLGTRSRGFVWFFSFVAWYSQIKRRSENVILLLDEPVSRFMAERKETCFAISRPN